MVAIFVMIENNGSIPISLSIILDLAKWYT